MEANKTVALLYKSGIVHDSLVAALQETGFLDFAGSVNKCGDAYDFLHAKKPDLVVVDTSLPISGWSGIPIDRPSTIGDYCTSFPHSRFYALSGTLSDDLGIELLQRGVQGYSYVGGEGALSCSAIAENAVKLSFSDDPIFPASVNQKCMRSLLNGYSPDGIAGLSPGQRRVFIAYGYSGKAKEVADLLNIGVRTVNSHTGRIKEKMGFGSVGAIRLAAHFYVRTGELPSNLDPIVSIPDGK